MIAKKYLKIYHKKEGAFAPISTFRKASAPEVLVQEVVDVPAEKVDGPTYQDNGFAEEGK